MVYSNIFEREKDLLKYEFQLKFKVKNISEEDILSIGAKRLGSVFHEDTYFVPKSGFEEEYFRIRKEGEELLLFTYKKFIRAGKIKVRKIVNKLLSEKDYEKFKKDFVEVLKINKKRTIFSFDSVIINFDKVERIGSFLEFEVSNEKDLYKLDFLIKKFGLNKNLALKQSYFEIAKHELSKFHKFLDKLYSFIGNFSFGISSAVLTTLGMIVGLDSATKSEFAVISGIVSVAIADSFSDAIGMYSSKKSERGVSSSSAFKSAFNVFLGKLVFTLSFIFPFLFFSYNKAIFLSILWGLFLLAVVNMQIAYVNEENSLISVIKNTFIALTIMFLSFIAGMLISIIL